MYRLLRRAARSMRRQQSSIRRMIPRIEPLEPRLALSTIVEDDNWQFEEGGMKDLNTGLVWSTSAKERTDSWWTYSRALNLNNTLVEGGLDDWRLPTQAELKEAASHGIGNHAYAKWMHGGQAPTVWSTAKCSAQQGGHIQISLFDGTASCLADASAIDTVAVRGTRAVRTYTTPNIRVFSQLIDTVEAGHGGRFTLALDTQPTANVTIPIASGDITEGTVSATKLVFTPNNWNVPQGVGITPKDDMVFDPDESYQVVLGPTASDDSEYSGKVPPMVHVVNRDNDQAIKLLRADVNPITDENGAPTTVFVSLNGQPAIGTTVVLDLTTFKPGEGAVAPTHITFDHDNWDNPQAVVVTGQPDTTCDGDSINFLRATVNGATTDANYLGAQSSAVEITNVDTDCAVQHVASGSVNLAIPDYKATGFTLSKLTTTLNVPSAGPVGDINLTLSINHPDLRQLAVRLIPPDGSTWQYVLSRSTPGTALTNTTFDDEAQSRISDGLAPYTGTFRLQNDDQRLRYFDGLQAQGNWTLQIYDHVKGLTGQLVSWSLDVKIVPPAAAFAGDTDAALMLFFAEDALPKRTRA